MPQLTHRDTFTDAISVWGPRPVVFGTIEIASNGQSVAHCPQPVQAIGLCADGSPRRAPRGRHQAGTLNGTATSATIATQLHGVASAAESGTQAV